MSYEFRQDSYDITIKIKNSGMKKMLFMITCIVLSCFIFQACKSKDERINKNVSHALLNNYPTMYSSVKDGVVTLGGTAQTQQQKSQVEGIVRSISNVKSVINNVTVIQPITPDNMNQDVFIKSTIEEKLRSAGFNDVYVESTNGEVVLTGNIDRKDLAGVMEIANESNPQRVVNNLNIR
jgi:osmotically-inducible protein OsmY